MTVNNFQEMRIEAMTRRIEELESDLKKVENLLNKSHDEYMVEEASNYYNHEGKTSNCNSILHNIFSSWYEIKNYVHHPINNNI